MKHAGVTVLLMFIVTATSVCLGQSPITLNRARALQCSDSLASCQEFDAVVFVHGIYGNDATFKKSVHRV
jgi:hypothetical protein